MAQVVKKAQAPEQKATDEPQWVPVEDPAFFELTFRKYLSSGDLKGFDLDEVIASLKEIGIEKFEFDMRNLDKLPAIRLTLADSGGQTVTLKHSTETDGHVVSWGLGETKQGSLRLARFGALIASTSKGFRDDGISLEAHTSNGEFGLHRAQAYAEVGIPVSTTSETAQKLVAEIQKKTGQNVATLQTLTGAYELAVNAKTAPTAANANTPSGSVINIEERRKNGSVARRTALQYGSNGLRLAG